MIEDIGPPKLEDFDDVLAVIEVDDVLAVIEVDDVLAVIEVEEEREEEMEEIETRPEDFD